MNAPAVLHWHARRSARRAADRWLLTRHPTGPRPDGLGARVAELTAPKERVGLARTIRGLLDDLARKLPSASPVNRRAARANGLLLGRLADRLDDLAQPVDACAMLRTERLLCDGASPLYAPGDGAELRSELRGIVGALER
jgi:hypothetical protein